MSLLHIASIIFILICNPIEAEEELHKNPKEALFGYNVTGSGISIRVFTGGCTEKNNFKLKRQTKPYGLEIEFERVSDDRCKGNFPYGIIIDYSWEELGIPPNSNFIISNKILTEMK